MARAPVLQVIEALPEADRLDEVPHPRATTVLHGHSQAEQTLVAGIASGRMHHGLLITGPEGIGKATLAYRFARHALADPTERDPFGQSLDIAAETVAARQVQALSHPGLLLIRRPWDPKGKRFTASIPVDEVRRIKAFLAHTAATDSNRVVIVDSADELNVNAANALLKSLEEPPPRTFVVLVAATPGRLLPTIRSRCRTLALQPLAEQNLRRAAQAALMSTEREPPGAAEWTRLVALAQGSVRRLLVLWMRDGLKLQDRIDALFKGLPRIDWSLVHTLGDELGSVAAADKFETFYELLMQHLASLIRAAAANGAAGGDPAGGQAPGMAAISAARLASWAELWETLVREKAEAMALNLDRKSLILEAFSRIESVTRR
ncbi:MAG: DNA polymerase III subunit delta' [Hyphomicrobiaceae bacterium]